jgi:hypothetical protein
VALAGLFRAAPSAAAPIDVVRGCAEHASAALSGIKDLNSVCPGLEEALQALGLDRLLYDGWRRRLNRDSLRDVAKLVDEYGGTAPAGPPDVAALAGVLETLSSEQTPAPKSWWDVFSAWLDHWLKSHGGGPLSWLDRWLDVIRQSVTLLNVILCTLVGLVLIAAGWIVVNELQAAGLIGRGRIRAPAANRDAADGDAAARGMGTPPDAEPVALAERLSLLLRLLVARLTQTGRLNAERSLTHRELVLRARFDTESQRAVFGTVASTAESVLYGARSATPEHLGSVLRQGHALLAELPDSMSAR